MTDTTYFLFPIVYAALNAASFAFTGWTNTKQEKKSGAFRKKAC